MEFHRISPHRACDIWTYSDFEPGPGPARTFRHMVFAYDFPSEDCIFKDPPYYFVTRRGGAVVSTRGLSGAETRPVDTRVSEAYVQLYGTPASIPGVEQLLVTGAAGEDDFGLQHGRLLIVSNRALLLLLHEGMKDAEVVPYDPAYRIPTPAELLARR